MKNQSLGFTLVELLIVVSIIGLLAVIAAYSIPYTRARARDSKRASDIDQFMKALDLYVSQHGAYPVASTPVCLDGSDSVTQALQGDNVISTTVKEPFYTDASKCYSYSTDSSGEAFSIDFYYETNAVGPQGKNTRP